MEPPNQTLAQNAARIVLSDHAIPDTAELVELYGSVGWTSYTQDPERLREAVAHSLRVVCARDGERLVGLARMVGDGLTIVHMQDILVAPTHQRLGIGTQLFRALFEPFDTVRQKVLLTDDEPRQRAFYESMGFTEINDLDQPLRAFVQLG